MTSSSGLRKASSNGEGYGARFATGSLVRNLFETHNIDPDGEVAETLFWIAFRGGGGFVSLCALANMVKPANFEKFGVTV